ncbi:MAG: hypothetical protein QOG62_1536 [Thermoleophilaceae bacterium]|nr:hypothetical protein [Thermoleophilaceae bacterium]
MIILRDPGEVFALRHTLGRRPLEDPVTAWVERLDPVTLETIVRSPDLASGQFWPGGVAAHANGSLIVVSGNHCHRLSAELEPLAQVTLPAPRPYNSFVVLPDGTLVMKDFDRTLLQPSRLTVLDPDTLEPRAADVDLGEPSIARLSADGNDVYVVGAQTVKRFSWTGTELVLDTGWGSSYLSEGGSYGWDPVIEGGHLWFLDNGDHDFVTTMRGAGIAPGPVHLIRMSLTDPADRESVEVCGAARGAVTDPPLYDTERGIAIAYDSANGVVQAFSFDGRLTPLWRRELSHSAHMILYPDTGELVVHDFHGPAFGRTAPGRAVMRRSSFVMHRPALRRVAATQSRDDVVVLDIETGSELGRAPVPTLLQSVVFPSPGFDRDIYWVTMSTIARVAVA